MGNTIRPLVNVIIGIILIILGIVWYFVRIPLISDFISYYMTGPVTFIPFWKIPALLIVGLFGICIFFVGLILAWIGWNDYKMEKELAEEEAGGTENEEWEAEGVENEGEEAEDEKTGEEETDDGETEEAVEEKTSSREEKLEKGLMTEISEEKPGFVCDICGKKVKSKAGLVAHKRIHK